MVNNWLRVLVIVLHDGQKSIWYFEFLTDSKKYLNRDVILQNEDMKMTLERFYMPLKLQCEASNQALSLDAHGEGPGLYWCKLGTIVSGTFLFDPFLDKVDSIEEN